MKRRLRRNVTLRLEILAMLILLVWCANGEKNMLALHIRIGIQLWTLGQFACV